MDEGFGSYFGVKNGKGALIKKIIEDTPAEEYGLKSGDVIIRIDKKNISSVKDVTRILSEHKGGDKINIEILRHKKSKTLRIELDERRSMNLRFLDDFGRLKKLKGIFNLKDLEFNFDDLKHQIRNLKLETKKSFDKNGEKIIIKRKFKYDNEIEEL